MEIVLKCVLAGFLSGLICRNFFQWNPQDKQQNVLAIGATVSWGIGLYFVAQDTQYFAQIATQIRKTEVGPFF